MFKTYWLRTLPAGGAGARANGRLKGNFGIRLLRFNRVGDRILEQKSIRINTVFRERTKAAYLKWTKERERGSRKKQV